MSLNYLIDFFFCTFLIQGGGFHNSLSRIEPSNLWLPPAPAPLTTPSPLYKKFTKKMFSLRDVGLVKRTEPNFH